MGQRYCIQERVRWGDVDAAKIIFYGAYIRFFEFAESELFRSVGLSYSRMYDGLDVWLPRVHIECDFHSVARLDDLLEVSVQVSRMGNSSIHLDFQVHRVADGAQTATASFVLVSVERETFAKVPVPEEMRQLLSAYRADID